MEVPLLSDTSLQKGIRSFSISKITDGPVLKVDFENNFDVSICLIS